MKSCPTSVLLLFLCLPLIIYLSTFNPFVIARLNAVARWGGGGVASTIPVVGPLLVGVVNVFWGGIR